jgi:hypothetical protein
MIIGPWRPACSEDKVCGQCAVTTGDVLNSRTFSMAVPPADTFIHLDRLGQLLGDGPVAGLYTTEVCTCDGGFRKGLGLVTIQQMVAALV